MNKQFKDYEIIRDYINDGFHSIHYLINNRVVNLNTIRIFKKAGILTIKEKNSKSHAEYSVLNLSYIEFMEVLAKSNNLMPIYIFNAKNELIDCQFKIKTASKLYNTDILTLKRMLSNKKIKIRHFYFSYDKNYVISNIIEPKPKKEPKKERLNKMIEGDWINKLKNNKTLLTSEITTIARVFNCDPNSIYHYQKTNKEFAEVMELREKELEKIKILAKLKESKKQQVFKYSNVLGYEKKWSDHKKAIALAEQSSPKKAKKIGKLGEEGIKQQLKKTK